MLVLHRPHNLGCRRSIHSRQKCLGGLVEQIATLVAAQRCRCVEYT
jgi:hypothetical protein